MMDTSCLSSGQFGGTTSSLGGGNSGSDVTGLGGPLGSSGMPSPMGAGASSMGSYSNGGQ